MPATARGIRKEGWPILPKLCEQMNSDTSRIPPSPYTLWDGVSFIGLPCPSATVSLHLPTVRASPLFAAHGLERAAIPPRAEADRQLRLCRKKDLRSQRRAQEHARVIRVSPARCQC